MQVLHLRNALCRRMVAWPHHLDHRWFHTEKDIYTGGSTTPSILGCITCSLFEGMGRGVIATANISRGDLIMCSRPAVVIEGPADAAPDAALLVPALMQAVQSQAGPALSAALQHLFDGTDVSRQQVPDMQQLMEPEGSSSSSSDTYQLQHSSIAADQQQQHSHHNHNHQHCNHHNGTTEPQLEQQCTSHAAGCCNHHHQQQHHAPDCHHGPEHLSEQRAGLLVKYNAFGDDYEDLAAAVIQNKGLAIQQSTAALAAHNRARRPHSVVGLWPGFAMVNHSCLPNTVHYVVGHALVVRAVEDVSKASELTASYLGREEFAPVGARQAVLQERFGFSCSCQRCRREQQLPGELQHGLAHIYATVMQELKPCFLDAVEQQNQSQLAQVHSRLQQLEKQLTSQLQRYMRSSSKNAVLEVQSTVYDLYELLLFCEQLVGQGNMSEAANGIVARLGICLAITNRVSKGAELHIYLASRLLQYAINLRGADSVQAEAAAALCQEAYLLRYGDQLEAEVMLQLMEANKHIAEEFLL